MTGHHRCPDCTLWHKGGRCQPLPMWPSKPLVDRFESVRDLQLAIGAHPNGFVNDMISDLQADRWATRLGLHPDQVWPGWSAAGLRYVDRVFLESGWRQAWLQWERTTNTAVEAV